MKTIEFLCLSGAGLLILAAVVTLLSQRTSLGNSPWYWVCVFSTFALAALFVMDGKYGRRQDHLENEYRYGTRSLTPPEAKPQTDVTPAPGPDLTSTSTPPASNATSGRIISLWPLRIAAIGATLMALVMLVCRSHSSRLHPS